MSTLSTLAAAAVSPGFGGAHGGDGPLFPFVLIPLFWLLLLGGIAVAVVIGRRRRDRLAGATSGERVLAERYAAGEIDDNEYRSRRAVLREKE